jgi:hypothetical protein
VYVGEADDVWSRLASHDDKKDFWTWVILFVSTDDNLTKAHVRWLEATLVREMKKAKRAEIENGNEPGGGHLPEADTADMIAYFENVKLLLPTLGLNVLALDAPTAGKSRNDVLTLELRWEDALAECRVINGQFVVQPGSTARVKEVDSLGEGSRALRRTLRDTGLLVPEEASATLLRFTQEYAFDSPSAAAAVVSGTGLNGRTAWKLRGDEGLSYKAWQERQVDEAGERDEAS